jgi:hypothetical protein
VHMRYGGSSAGNVQSFDRADRMLLARPKKKDTKKIDAVIGSVVAFAVA